jgi:hypothetical protein
MRTAALSVITLLAAGSARAQFTQYTAPGSLAEEQIPTQERIKAAVEEASYHLGPLRFGPWLALKDVAYVNNVYGTETDPKSDVTATLGVGVQAYLPAGNRVTLGMYALPEYVWWRDLSNKRGWNGTVGAGVFGYFNRMTVEVQAGGSRYQQYVSSEVDVPVNLEDTRATALVEVQVVGQLSLFCRAGVDQWRYNQRGLTPDLVVELTPLDRDEKHAGGGVRFHLSRTVSLGLGLEQYTTDFVHSVNGRSNSGPAPIAELRVQTGHLSVIVNAIALDLKPSGQSEFVQYSGTNGGFQIGFRPAGKVQMLTYGSRNLVYSATPGIPYYLDDRVGVALQSPLGWRANGRVFVESGHDRYVVGSGIGAGRTDDLKDYGAVVNIQIGRWATLVAGGDRTNYTSKVAGYDRSVTTIRTGLQIASGKAQWW